MGFRKVDFQGTQSSKFGWKNSFYLHLELCYANVNLANILRAFKIFWAPASWLGRLNTFQSLLVERKGELASWKLILKKAGFPPLFIILALYVLCSSHVFVTLYQAKLSFVNNYQINPYIFLLCNFYVMEKRNSYLFWTFESLKLIYVVMTWNSSLS